MHTRCIEPKVGPKVPSPVHRYMYKFAATRHKFRGMSLRGRCKLHPAKLRSTQVGHKEDVTNLRSDGVLLFLGFFHHKTERLESLINLRRFSRTFSCHSSASSGSRSDCAERVRFSSATKEAQRARQRTAGRPATTPSRKPTRSYRGKTLTGRSP